MRILHVLPNGDFGGTQKLVLGLASGARAAGHETALAAATGQATEAVQGQTMFELPVVDARPSARMLRTCATLRRIIREWKPDVVHAHTVRVAPVVAAVTRRGREPRALVTVYGGPGENATRSARILRIAGLQVVSDGPGLAEMLNERGALTQTIANGVSPPPAPANREKFQRDWAIARGTRIIVAVGRLVPQKNHSLAVRALPLIRDAVLVVVGGGPLHDNLRSEAEVLGVADRVLLIGFREDGRALTGMADVVVMPSVWEGLPLAALDALSAGVPLVASDIPGFKWLTHGGDSLLVPLGDATALAAALQSILDDPNLAARLSAGGRVTALQYTEDAMLENYLNLYSEIAANKKTPGASHALE